MSVELEIFVDGACSGNPGRASVGVVINKDNVRIKEFAKDIGNATNNIAEYSALIYALQEAHMLRADKVNVFTDSELVYKQVIGSYRVKDEKLKPLFAFVKHLETGFKSFDIKHVRREFNKEADKLASDLLQFRKS